MKEQEQGLVKKSKSLANEILKEKVTLEKCRIEEAESSSALRQEEDERDTLQTELELTEQKSTMANYELMELQKMHEELTETLENMKKENSSIVLPVLTGLRTEVCYVSGSRCACVMVV